MVDELDRRRFLKQTAVAAGATLAPRLARAQVPSDRPVIGQGLQIGDVLPGSAIVWSRSDRPARMLVEWATTDGFKHAFRVRGPHALEVTNYTARIDLTDLPEDQDIFVHMETVRRGGLSDLIPDQPLRARIANGRKGPLAVEVEPA